jgi:hypothetical protein
MSILFKYVLRRGRSSVYCGLVCRMHWTFSLTKRYFRWFDLEFPENMRKLPEVEEAKALMNEAVSWSVMKWLREKKRVRQVADRANAALDELDRAIKARWNAEFRAAYDELSAQADTRERRSQPSPKRSGADGVRYFARQVKEADDEAYRARMDAEKTFDEAERQLSTALAREGCHKAILSWDLHEKAIRRAEA